MEQLIERLKNGGKIVCSSECSILQIAKARVCGRMYVDNYGFGFIYLAR